MARPLQKKKNKSSLPRVRQKSKSKRLNIKSNPIVAANWNSHLTLSQNYRRLGLTSTLNKHSGGTEPRRQRSADWDDGVVEEEEEERDSLQIPSSKAPLVLGMGEVRVQRDAVTGAILKVEGEAEEGEGEDNRGSAPWRKGLQDPLNEIERIFDGPTSISNKSKNGRGRGIVPLLEAEARRGVDGGKKRRVRKQTEREREWIARLVGRWGDDVQGMARDRKMNPMQLSVGEVGRRVRVWRGGRGEEEGDGEDRGDGGGEL